MIPLILLCFWKAKLELVFQFLSNQKYSTTYILKTIMLIYDQTNTPKFFFKTANYIIVKCVVSHLW